MSFSVSGLSLAREKKEIRGGEGGGGERRRRETEIGPAISSALHYVEQR